MSAAEVAAANLPGLPADKRGLNALAAAAGWASAKDSAGRPLSRPRAGRGGGVEYHVSVLPQAAQIALGRAVIRVEAAAIEAEGAQDEAVAARIEAFERLPAPVRRATARRLAVIDRVEALEATFTRNTAVAMAAREANVSPATVWNWLQRLHGVPRIARLAHLAPMAKGRPERAEISPAAWAFYKDAWLRPAQPTHEACHRLLTLAAAKQGWTVPSLKTLQRRIMAEVPVHQRVLRREGVEALARLYPAQERDRSHFGAMQCVCADGHKWDVMVEWPDGTIARPISLAFQDLHSNKIVAIRHGQAESAHLIALAIHDMARDWGAPDQAWLDNGRGFASKWITGQQPTRFRFKVKDSDPPGLLTQIGTQVHWAKPYSGQSKPIERAFRDFASELAKHPAFDGAYTGNSPMAKPSDYGSRAVPLAVFERIVAAGVAEHNARPGRRTTVCGGVLSFDQAFAQSYETRLISKPAPSQLRAMLLASDQLTVRGPAGSLHIGGNRFWHEALAAHIGRKVVVKFDPDALKDPLAVFTLDGAALCVAECLEAVGFDSAEDAKTHERARKAWTRAQKELAALEKRFTAADICALIADVSEDGAPPRAPQKPRPAATRMMPGLAVAAAPAADTEFDDLLDFFAQRTAPRGHLRLIQPDDA